MPFVKFPGIPQSGKDFYEQTKTIVKQIDDDILTALTFGFRSEKRKRDPPSCPHCLNQCSRSCFYCYVDLVSDADGFFIFCDCHSHSVFPITIGQRYQLARELSRGCFSSTFLAIDRFSNCEDHYVCLKVINKNFQYIGMTEIQFLQFLNQNDPHDTHSLVRLREKFFYGPDALVLVEDYLPVTHMTHSLLPFKTLSNAECSTFDEYLERKKSCLQMRSRFQKIALQCMRFLLLLGRFRIIHADIKLENLLFENTASMKLRFIDFGNALFEDYAAHYYDDFEIQALCYRAPEVLAGVPFGCAIDMWSVGVVLLELWLGENIFRTATDRSQVFHLICDSFKGAPASFGDGALYEIHQANPFQGKPIPIRERLVSSGMDVNGVDFLLQILRVDPDHRITPARALSHPFLASFCADIVPCT